MTSPAILLYGDDELLLRDACRQVLQRELPTSWVRSVMGSDEPRPEAWSTFAELGWTGVAVPEAHGGMGFGLSAVTVLAEEFGRAVQPGPFLASSVVALAIADLAEAGEADRRLGPLGTGELIGTWSVDVDGGAGAVVATSEEGGWRLRGVRGFVPDAAQATHLLIAADDGTGRRLFMVDLAAPGVTTRPQTTVDLGRHYAEVRLDDVLVDSELADARADDASQHLVDLGTVVQCAESLGAAEQVLEMTVAYAAQRRQFGRAIGSFQAIKHRLADMRIKVQAGRAAVRYATFAVAGRRPDATRAVHVAKQWIGSSAGWIAGEALQVHGGIGFTWEHDLHLYLRRITANELTLGSPDWHAQRLGEWCLTATSASGA